MAGTSTTQNRTGYGGHVNGRRRAGAQYDQNNQLVTYQADGTVAPPGTTGVGATRPHQASDNIGANGGESAWHNLFPRNPDGSARLQPAPRPAPAAASAPVAQRSGFAAIAPNLFPAPAAPAPTQLSPAARPYMPQRVQLAHTPNVSLPNGESYNSTRDGLEIEYDPRRDTTRRGTNTQDILDPSRTTRTVAIDPRYGGGVATGKVNGGTRDSVSNQYADAVDAGTAAALNAAGERTDRLNAAAKARSDQELAMLLEQEKQLDAGRAAEAAEAQKAAAAAYASRMAPTTVAQDISSGARGVMDAIADIPGAIARDFDHANQQKAEFIDDVASGWQGIESQRQKADRLNRQIQALPPPISTPNTPVRRPAKKPMTTPTPLPPEGSWQGINSRVQKRRAQPYGAL